MKKIGIVGGGIIGLSSAYYLRKAGFHVTIYDQTNLQDGCSFGNAGMIVPSHFVPLASPGMVAKGIRWMFNSKSPFYVKPRMSKELIQWGYQFYKHANRAHVDRSMSALSSLSLFSKTMYRELAATLPFDFGFTEKGLLMLYHKPEVEKEEIEAAHLANRIGIDAQVMTLADIQKLEPHVRVSARGGVYYPGDAHLTPHRLVEKLIIHLREQGVVFESAGAVTGFVVEENSVKAVKTIRGEFDVDELVIASGSWSGQLCSMLGLSLPLQAGKGYSFTLQDVQNNICIPTIFLEARVSVTPMGSAMRFGGTMEITGIDHTINMNRVRGIVDSIRNYYPDMAVPIPSKDKVWHGLRPCSPDGLPYIGRSRRKSNLVVATGHSMMGVSLGPATGKLVSEIVSGVPTTIDIAPFDPDRY